MKLIDPRLLIVTGKGGVGKSTVAAALAVRAAHAGRRTCLVEVEGRQTFSSLFDTAPWGFEEREFRPGLFGLSIDPRASMREYLSMFYGGERLSRLLVSTPAVEFATQAAPGIKDVLLIGKVKEMERRRGPDGRFAYDHIVLDAPPTGRITNFLRAPDATTELVNVGAIRQQAQAVIDMLLDEERTSLVLVTLLEEMPVTETLESARQLRDFGVALGPVVVNRVTPTGAAGPAADTLAALTPADVVEVLAAQGLRTDEAAATELLELGTAHRERLELEDRMRKRLVEALDTATVEVPFIAAERFSADAIALIADALEVADR